MKFQAVVNGKRHQGTLSEGEMKTLKNIRLHLAGCVSLLCLAASLPALANDVKEMTLAQKVDASDLVFIARVISVEEPCVRKSSCATLRISQRLKGA